MFRSLPRTLLLATVLTILTSGCTTGDRNPSSAALSTPVANSSGPTQSISTPRVTTPPAEPNVQTIATTQAQTGGYAVAVTIVEREIWVFVSCVHGIIEVSVSPIASMPVTCSDSSVTGFTDEFEVTAAERNVTVKITVTSGSPVWSVRVGQGK